MFICCHFLTCFAALLREAGEFGVGEKGITVSPVNLL